MTIMECWDLCNQYGLDTLTTAAYIAWVMELYQRGILTKEQVGLDLSWSNASDAVPRMVEMIGNRQGVDVRAKPLDVAAQCGVVRGEPRAAHGIARLLKVSRRMRASVRRRPARSGPRGPRRGAGAGRGPGGDRGPRRGQRLRAAWRCGADMLRKRR